MENKIPAPLRIEMTIEKDSCSDGWHQAYLIINELKVPIGDSYFDYHDCRMIAEKIVEEFSKNQVHILHSKIYDLYDDM